MASAFLDFAHAAGQLSRPTKLKWRSNGVGQLISGLSSTGPENRPGLLRLSGPLPLSHGGQGRTPARQGLLQLLDLAGPQPHSFQDGPGVVGVNVRTLLQEQE